MRAIFFAQRPNCGKCVRLALKEHGNGLRGMLSRLGLAFLPGLLLGAGDEDEHPRADNQQRRQQNKAQHRQQVPPQAEPPAWASMSWPEGQFLVWHRYVYECAAIKRCQMSSYNFFPSGLSGKAISAFFSSSLDG